MDHPACRARQGFRAPHALAAIELGRAAPSFASVQAILDALELDLHDLADALG